jgi:MFS family permease
MVIGALTQLMWLTYAPITSQTQHLMGVGEFKVVLLAMMFPLLFVPLSIPVGIIIDRKGFRFAVMVGAILTAGFSFLRLAAGNYTLVLIGMIGISIGQPFVLNAVTKMVATWFPAEESALATGLGALSQFVGIMAAQAITPPLLNALGGTLSSLRSIVLIYSLVAAAGAVFFALFGKARPPKPPKRAEHDVAGAEVSVSWRGVKTVLALRNFRIFCLIVFVGNGSFVGLLQLLEKILKPKGISTTTAGNIGALIVVAGVIGCVVFPAISDKLRRRKPFPVIATLVTAPVLFLMGALHGTGAMFLLGAILGLFLLGAFPIVLAFSEETTGAHLTGTATSVLLMLGNGGGVIMTVIMEAIKGSTGGKQGSFFWAMAFLAASFAVGAVVAFRLRENPSFAGSPTQRAE